MVEIGAGQETAVRGLFTKAGLTVAAARLDLAGTPRVIEPKLSNEIAHCDLRENSRLAYQRKKTTWNVMRKRLASGHGIDPIWSAPLGSPEPELCEAAVQSMTNRPI